MTDRLAGKVAVITGGSSGIGKATVLRFLDEGARVVVGDLNEASNETLINEVADHDRLRVLRTDVSDEDQVAALVAAAVDAFGRLDVMFNNAGIGGAFGPLVETDVEHWDRTFAVLTRSVFLGMKHAARVMIPQGGGSIVNTASIAGRGGGAGPLAYSGAKAAVINITLNAAVELAPHRIRVNAICPGFIRTPLAVGRNEAAVVAGVVSGQPWPEVGEGADIAGACLFLASDDAGFITGESITVDGGLLAAGPDLNGKVDSTGSWQRRAGFAHGTTGVRPEVRPLGGPTGG